MGCAQSVVPDEHQCEDKSDMVAVAEDTPVIIKSRVAITVAEEEDKANSESTCSGSPSVERSCSNDSSPSAVRAAIEELNAEVADEMKQTHTQASTREPSMRMSSQRTSQTDDRVSMRSMRSSPTGHSVASSQGVSQSARLRPFVPYCQQQLVREIGRGSFSSVWLAQSATGDSVAVKVVEMKRETSSAASATRAAGKFRSNQSTVRREVALLSAVSEQSRCIKLLDAYEDGGFAFIVMEKCDCSFFTFLRRRHDENLLTSDTFRDIFQQMFVAVSQVHSEGLVHRDIKPDNFLVNLSRSGTDFQVKLCDFGLASTMGDVPLTNTCGTAPYLAPEMVQGRQYDQKVDIWSMGVLMYVMMYGAFTYVPKERTPQAMKDAIRNARDNDINFAAPTHLKSLGDATARAVLKARPLLEGALKRNPSLRMSASKALEQPWLVKEQKDACDFRPVFKAAHRAGAFNPKVFD